MKHTKSRNFKSHPARLDSIYPFPNLAAPVAPDDFIIWTSYGFIRGGTLGMESLKYAQQMLNIILTNMAKRTEKHH